MCVCVCCRGGRGGGGGGGGEGVGWGGGQGKGGFWWPPATDSPNPLEEAKLHRRTLGLIYGFTQRDPPPPPTMVTLRGGGQWGGIKRWGIKGIRIGTSDRFGRGRGELVSRNFSFLIRSSPSVYEFMCV